MGVGSGGPYRSGVCLHVSSPHTSPTLTLYAMVDKVLGYYGRYPSTAREEWEPWKSPATGKAV